VLKTAPSNDNSAAPVELAERLASVTAERDSFKTERDSFKRLYLEVLAQCRKLELGIVGRGH
jgi:hypothetical protein